MNNKELIKAGHELAKAISNDTPLIEIAKMVSNLATQLDVQLARSNTLAAESSKTSERLQQLIQIISNADNEYCMCGDAMKKHVHGGCGHPTGMFDYHYNQWLESGNKTPTTDAFLAEVRAHDLNAFIRHHSAELDAHIKNGGEQFDEKSVRIRDIIVSARLFREQIRKEAAQ